jgi:hypothetical protein
MRNGVRYDGTRGGVERRNGTIRPVNKTRKKEVRGDMLWIPSTDTTG